MKTAVIYARYSSERQTEQSIEGQLHVCNDYAKRNDLVIVGTYIDRAMTGTNDNREDFQRMLKDSDKKSFDYVLVYKLDRFSRNKYEMAIHRKHLKDNGVKILSAMENISVLSIVFRKFVSDKMKLRTGIPVMERLRSACLSESICRRRCQGRRSRSS